MQVGRTKDQGLYNKPPAAVHPGALTAGTLPQYSTISPIIRLHSQRDSLQRQDFFLFSEAHRPNLGPPPFSGYRWVLSRWINSTSSSAQGKNS